MPSQHFLKVERPVLGTFRLRGGVAFDREAAELARATRARNAFQSRLVDTFRMHLEGGPEPSDADLQMFARLAAAEHALERQLAKRKANLGQA